ncbi:hypothetical protein ACFV2B_38930 [Streptomyces lavendulae]|uniref:hypothetical protein n=1 Tax=Streptomyces lavendulae TaxID=1914 RepID=UPI00369553DE
MAAMGEVPDHPHRDRGRRAAAERGLPARLDEEACTEIDSSIYETVWTGTFHMPRADVRDWLVSLPFHRGGPPALSQETDFNTFSFVPPSAGRIESVEVSVKWRGEAGAVITFTTYNG